VSPERSKGSPDDLDYDHLDIIKSDSMIRAYFSRVVTRLEQLNPHAASEADLREKASRL
jgi:hypothetical protein